MKGRMKRALKDRKGQSHLRLTGATQKGTALPATAIWVRPGLSSETNSRFYTSEEREN